MLEEGRGGEKEEEEEGEEETKRNYSTFHILKSTLIKNNKLMRFFP